MGATWIGGGVAGILELLSRSLRPSGMILVGEPFWRQMPPTEEVARGCHATSIADFLMLPGLIASFGDLGYDVVEMVLADQDGWDRYEAAKWLTMCRWLIGPSNDLPVSLNRHRFQLEMGSHPDKELQHDWTELGPNAFVIEVLDHLEVPEGAACCCRGPGCSAPTVAREARRLRAGAVPDVPQGPLESHATRAGLTSGVRVRYMCTRTARTLPRAGSMDDQVWEPVTFEHCDHVTGPFYHGTKSRLRPGDELTPGFGSNFQDGRVSNHIYFTALMDTAAWGAELATALAGAEERGHIYVVEPAGPFEDDPNVTNKRSPGNPTRSYRTPGPLRVISEVEDWEGHSPEVLKGMLDHLAQLREQGLDVIED